jgi:hypothetical protein
MVTVRRSDRPLSQIMYTSLAPDVMVCAIALVGPLPGVISSEINRRL